jgi:hypothetical protein
MSIVTSPVSPFTDKTAASPTGPGAPGGPCTPVGPVGPVGPTGPSSPDAVILKPVACIVGINITYTYFNHSGLFGSDKLIVTSNHCLYQIFNSCF